MLNPNARCLYTSALTPPPGMIFEEAIATTYSMDPVLLLEMPVYLALMTADGQSDPDPLSVLEAIRRYAKKITVYVQRGRIQVPQIGKPNPLFGFLEEMVVEVKSPGGGVFHPKIWAIRFSSVDGKRSIYRLVVLTRNMTTDQSWDLSLQLDGVITECKLKLNKPLVAFFKMLPSLATSQMDRDRVIQAQVFGDELYRVDWELPEGFGELSFYLPGTRGFDWKPPTANRMVVISPFCSDEVLRTLAKSTKTADALISRPESLAALSKGTLALFSKCLHLDEAAETDDGAEENTGEHPLATGLHAKVYLFETQYYSEYTHLVMGSANATNAALSASKNIEILVELVGKKNSVGGIDELIGSDGMGEYLVDYDPDSKVDVDTLRQEAEGIIDKARAVLAEANFSIMCQPGSEDGLWVLELLGEIPMLEGIVVASIWPITVTKDFALDLLNIDTCDGVTFKELSSSSVTGLIAFEVYAHHPDVVARFVLNLPISGTPIDRNAAILQTVISNQDGFIRYLLLLLGDETLTGLEGSGLGLGRWLTKLANGEDIPLLEELTRTYSRHPERLSEISGLVSDLSHRGQKSVVPDDFLSLWAVFESAIGECDD